MTRPKAATELLLGEQAEAGVEISVLSGVPAGIRPGEVGVPVTLARGVAFGAAKLGTATFAWIQAQRTPRLVRGFDPELYHVAVITSGQYAVEQFGTRSVLTSGGLTVLDSSAPYKLLIGGTPATHVVLQVPKTMVPLHHRQVTRLCGHALHSHTGTGRLLAQFLRTLAEDYTTYTAADVARLSPTAIDLATAALAHQVGDTAPLPEGSRADALFREISAFILRELADPQLSPDRIASSHHISVRYLHQIFQRHGATPTAFVTEERMRRCRRDLADPAHTHLTIAAIANRWGYPHPDRFSRAFRATTGMTPSEYRASVNRPAR
ncbi:hypothetical protein ALI144C_08035 [Actinosynnema sp. ALI-1.44]|uniref:helix-turn-helix domain-containing protein n=1 Tax=Actinosynnema sp. ALI-1.44 TaxID=1933779 RepID=UPI00097C413E|nr:helix-turn-helix domain-containing protein [Actinosynnema sp. ALI-1.44]ONI87876.1 hypothetical protein ALI144C_08035 [Actinosynnema sp. ALI-1.44]